MSICRRSCSRSRRVTDFAVAFTHVSERAARVTDLGVSVCAVLLAEACNTGLEPLVRHETQSLRRDRLSWVSQNYLRDETLRTANARLVAAQTGIPLARAWGGGEVASADGLRFVVPVRTVHAGPNPKYFGIGRGVTYYGLFAGGGVESTTGAVAVGGGGSCSRRLLPMPVPHSSPWLRFQSPLVEPDHADFPHLMLSNT